jgi:hypothetical protein
MSMNTKLVALKAALMDAGVTCDNNMDAVLDAATKYIKSPAAINPIPVIQTDAHSSGPQFDVPGEDDREFVASPPAKPKAKATKKQK